uniref:Uncharacterized protein n=1 Tax=Anguilla anguilla TaxID=7936 RepID=A0A0E9XID7_ANGAN
MCLRYASPAAVTPARALSSEFVNFCENQPKLSNVSNKKSCKMLW